MSSALNTAIYRRLTGVETMTGRYLAAQQALAAALGTDADTTLPNVFKGNVNDAPPIKNADGVLMPVITFRPSGGIPDHRFAHGLIVDNGMYDFEIWSWFRTANTISDIHRNMEILLDRRLDGPPLELSVGACAWFEPFVGLSEIYDEQRNGWIGLVRYQPIELRE